MGLCQGRTCGCSLLSSSLTITGDGTAGTPWQIEGAAPEKMTRAARLALTGNTEGRTVWETDTKQLWVYSVSAGDWYLVGNSVSMTRFGFGQSNTIAGRMYVAGDSTVVLTDGSAIGVVSYAPTVFASTPLLVFVDGDASTGALGYAQSANSPTGFSVRAFNTTNGVAYANLNIRVNWIAIGMLVP